MPDQHNRKTPRNFPAGLRHPLFSICIFVFLAVTHTAFAQDFTITKFHAAIAVNQDSSLLVQETILVSFRESRHAIYREIPFKYSDERGNTIRPPLHVHSVTDQTGTGINYRVAKKGNVVNIRIGDPKRFVSGFQTYVITYQVQNAILFLDDHEVSENFQPYAEAYYTDNETDSQLAPVPMAFPSRNLPITNPLLDPSVLALAATREDPTAPLVFRRRMVETGLRLDNYQFNELQFVVGSRGTITGSWRLFLLNLLGLLIGALLIFVTGLVAGIAARIWMPLPLFQANIHTHLWWANLFVLVVGADLIPGARTPKLVTREMISSMKPGTVVVGVSVDQGAVISELYPAWSQIVE